MLYLVNHYFAANRVIDSDVWLAMHLCQYIDIYHYILALNLEVVKRAERVYCLD